VESEFDHRIREQRALPFDGRDGVADDLAQLRQDRLFTAGDTVWPVGADVADGVDGTLVDDRHRCRRLIAVCLGVVAPGLVPRVCSDMLAGLYLGGAERAPRWPDAVFVGRVD